ncbi:MAG: ABC transporter permease [Bacilli bacterium]|jgi:oligopeptide transport system permease protein|nr:ABC transporter permease [Bacilli bacterium]
MNKKLLFYILKRLLLGILTYLIVVTVTFWVMQLVPGGPWTREKALSDAVIATLNERYGLDQPLFIQYLRYLGRALIFDFGVSYYYKGREVTAIIFECFRYSLVIGIIAALLALIIGLTFGTIAATHQNKFFDRFLMVITTASVAMPSFVISLILLYVFSVNLNLFPTSPVGAPPGIGPYVLPVIAESLYPAAYITRLVRSSTLDVLGQDFMRTAKAKGLQPGKVLMKHGLRNSITPVITYFGPMFASIITGSLVIEKVFQIPGIGRYFYLSIQNRDYPLIMGTTCLLAFLLIIFTLLSDIAYTIANPRVDFE